MRRISLQGWNAWARSPHGRHRHSPNRARGAGRNRLRTALTMLGMVIGIAAVITMVALGRGAQEKIDAQTRAVGTNLITVRAGNAQRGGINTGVGGAQTLTAADVSAIREQVPGAVYLAAGVSTGEQVVAAGQNWSTSIKGTDVELPLARSWDVKHGPSSPTCTFGTRQRWPCSGRSFGIIFSAKTLIRWARQSESATNLSR